MLKAKPYLKSIRIQPPEEADFDTHPFDIPAIKDIQSLDFHKDVTFFVGENGSGKSTLLEAIATVMEFGSQGGTGNFFVQDKSGQSSLQNYLRPVRSFQRPKDRYFLRAESFYNIGTYLEDLAKDPDAGTSEAQVFARYGGKSLHHRSHGESFMTILEQSFGGRGLYLLDEPEAALSPTRQLKALARIHELVVDESQFIIATHSPILLSYPNAWIYRFNESGCSKIRFEDTEHLNVTRNFLNDYKTRRADFIFRNEDEDGEYES